MSISVNSESRIRMMNGCEVQSLKHEGCVLIRKDKVFMDGEEVEILDTNKKVSYLWGRYVKQEGL